MSTLLIVLLVVLLLGGGGWGYSPLAPVASTYGAADLKARTSAATSLALRLL